MARPEPLTPAIVRQEVASGLIDTVSVAITDMQGRLQGKRIDADYFVEEVMDGHTEGCNYLMAVDVDMNTVDGYAMSSWDSGYGDFVMRPDLGTLHRVPWQEGAIGVLCDLEMEGGGPVLPSPRQVLRRQLDALDAAGYGAFVGTELESDHFVDLVAAGADHDDRDLGIGPNRSAHVLTVHVGQAEVQQDDVRERFARCCS